MDLNISSNAICNVSSRMSSQRCTTQRDGDWLNTHYQASKDPTTSQFQAARNIENASEIDLCSDSHRVTAAAFFVAMEFFLITAVNSHNRLLVHSLNHIPPPNPKAAR